MDFEEKRKRLQRMLFSDRKTSTKDPAYPGYHLAPPAHAIIDYWGNTYKNGWYHILYHAIPDERDPWSTVFGHARSRDLLHWEELSFPIIPKDSEKRLNDGCIVENGKGELLMLYTCCPQDETQLRTHAAARGDDDLHRFERIPEADPFLTMENHGGPVYQGGWSDPWVFRAQGRTFMLMSKCVLADGSADPMPIYEAKDESLLHWEYKGVFFDHNGEVINFFPVGEKWVLIYSPYHAQRYFVGEIDFEHLRFRVENEGTLSYGFFHNDHRGFYATCLYQNGAWEGERRVMTGWLSGTKETKGWRDCMGVPREVGINARLQVTQMPIAELDSLHKEKAVDVTDTSATVHTYLLPSSLLDIRLTYECDTPVTVTLTGTHTLLTLTIEKERFSVNGDTFHAPPFSLEGAHAVRLMIDRGSAEIFFEDGAVSATGFAPYAGEALTMTVAASTPVAVHRAQIWTMQEIHTKLHEECKEYEEKGEASWDF